MTFAQNLFLIPNSSGFRNIKAVQLEIDSLEQCANAIESGNYISAYDFNLDGYITADDYTALYNYVYSKYDTSDSVKNILLPIHIKKLLASGVYESDYDLTGDGVITANTLAVANRWILFGRTARAYV